MVRVIDPGLHGKRTISGLHLDSHWIQFDIPVHRQQIAVRVHESRLKSALPQRAGAIVGEVEVPDILATMSLYQSTDALLAAWRQKASGRDWSSAQKRESRRRISMRRP